MKKILYFLLAVVAVSCTDISTENVSKVTYYPVLTLNGDEIMFVQMGATFTDPGIVATEGNNAIEYTSSVKSKYRNQKSINTNIIDEYTITYAAQNKDGFSGTVNRKVVIYKNSDLINSIEGAYISTVLRNGSTLPSSQGSSVNMKYVYIWKNTDGSFEISDAFGGWYDIGRSFGADGASPGGTIKGNIATNSFTFPGNPFTNTYFGGPANITGVSVNPTNKTIILSCHWSGSTEYDFVSTLKLVQL